MNTRMLEENTNLIKQLGDSLDEFSDTLMVVNNDLDVAGVMLALNLTDLRDRMGFHLRYLLRQKRASRKYGI